MFKYTKHSLKKLEGLLEELGYTIRYEKGNFKSGYCIVENRKIAVVNKFFDTEARINCLLDVLNSIDVDESLFEEKTLAFYQKLQKQLEPESEESEN